MKLLLDVDIWNFAYSSVIGIPTNGFITRDGSGVMGRGLALQAKQKFPGVEKALGHHLLANGNEVGWIIELPVKLLAIPVKPRELYLSEEKDFECVLPHVRHIYKKRSTIYEKVIVPGFHCKADTFIIESSLTQLNDFVVINDIPSVHIPLLGCGNGGLSHTELVEILKRVKLLDNITLVYNRKII